MSAKVQNKYAVFCCHRTTFWVPACVLLSASVVACPDDFGIGTIRLRIIIRLAHNIKINELCVIIS